MAWDVVGIVTIWYFIVETKQYVRNLLYCTMWDPRSSPIRLSLEELDDIFLAKNPRKKASALSKQAKRRARADKRGEAYIDDSA
jgi:hypothetical protein